MRTEQLPDRLRQRGTRMTPQRAVILDILGKVEGHRHLAAQEVFEQARDRLPGLNLATVYRTLDMLCDAGVVDRMGAPGAGEVKFALRDPARRHCHLACRSCHRELELGLEVLLALADSVAQETGFQLDVDHLTLSGLCLECQESSRSDRT